MPTYAAYNSRVELIPIPVVAAFKLRANSVTVNVRTELADVTHFDQGADGETDGIGKYIPVVREADITIDAHWFSEDNPYGDPINLVPGQRFAIIIALEKDALPGVPGVGGSWGFVPAICEAVDHYQQIRDVIRFTARFKNSGLVWDKPTV